MGSALSWGMAQLLILSEARARITPTSPFVTLRAGDLVDDDDVSSADLTAQGVALVTYVPGTMAVVRETWLRTKNAPLFELMSVAGLI